MLLTLTLQLIIIYVLPLQPILHTEALSCGELGGCCLLSSCVLGVVEFEKWTVRRSWLYARHERAPGIPAKLDSH